MSSHRRTAEKIFRELLPETEAALAGEPEVGKTRRLYAPRTVTGGTTRAWNNKTDGHGLRSKPRPEKRRGTGDADAASTDHDQD